MTSWSLHFDMRAPAIGPPAPVLYAAALEMAEWADARGALAIVVSEHHGEPDGYLPSPLVLAGALAARTRSVLLNVSALVLTLRHPVAAAEDVLVVDQLSGGRVIVTLVPGYVPAEFELFGVPFADRGARFEAKVEAFLAALCGAGGVGPPPVHPPRPMVLLGGGSRAAARRAARLGDGFIPTVADPVLLDAYRAECERLGRPVGVVTEHQGPLSIHVADDPDAAWAAIGPHVLHELRAYGRLAASTPGVGAHPYAGLDDIEAARATGVVEVLTPEDCVALARSMPPGAGLVLKPLIGGLPPDLAWSSLERFAADVVPHLEPPAPGGTT